MQSGPLFPQITDMLVSWEKRAAGSKATTFRRLLADFWEGLGSLCVRCVDRQEPQVEQLALQGIASLLQIMHNPASCATAYRRKKTVKICLSEPDGKDQGEENLLQTSEMVQELQESPLRSRHLLDLVCQLAELNMVYVSERASERHLRFLALLLRAFPKAQVFQTLLKPEQVKSEAGSLPELRQMSGNPAVCFLLQRAVVWLRQDDRKETEFLVDIVFSALKCCDARTEQTLILNHVTVSTHHNPPP